MVDFACNLTRPERKTLLSFIERQGGKKPRTSPPNNLRQGNIHYTYTDPNRKEIGHVRMLRYVFGTLHKIVVVLTEAPQDNLRQLRAPQYFLQTDRGDFLIIPERVALNPYAV